MEFEGVIIISQNLINVLDEGIDIDPITENCCPKCKINQTTRSVCDKCQEDNYPFEEVFALGYYNSRWSRYGRTQISPDFIKNRLRNIHKEFLFSELLVYAKGQKKKPMANKNLIYEFLSKGFAKFMQENHQKIIENIDFIVHVPKINENKGLRYNNHALSYAKYISESLDIPFERFLLVNKGNITPVEIGYDGIKIENSTIMIVDDIFRDGLTKGPISKLLVEFGAKKVYIGVIGRSMNLSCTFRSNPIKLKL